jgi:DNA-binding response OmpR family regulator
MNDASQTAGALEPPLVLAVDDEPVNLAVIEGALAPLGYRVVCVADADAAMAEMLHIRPDVVLLDVMMPGESGLDLCRRIRSHVRLGDVPIVLVTALGAADSRTPGLLSGADDYIEKPIDVDELAHRVRSIVARTQDLRPTAAATEPGSSPRSTAEGAAALDADHGASQLLSIAGSLVDASRRNAGALNAALADAMARAAGLSSPSSESRASNPPAPRDALT